MQHQQQVDVGSTSAPGSQAASRNIVCACGRIYRPGGGYYAHRDSCEPAIRAAFIAAAPPVQKALEKLKSKLKNAPAESDLSMTLRCIHITETNIGQIVTDEQAAAEAREAVPLVPFTSEDTTFLEEMDFANLKTALKLTGPPTEAMVVALVQRVWLDPERAANLSVYADPSLEHALVYKQYLAGPRWTKVPRDKALQDLLSMAITHFLCLADTLGATADQEQNSSQSAWKRDGMGTKKLEALVAYLVETEAIVNDVLHPLPDKLQVALQQICANVYSAWIGKVLPQSGGSGRPLASRTPAEATMPRVASSSEHVPVQQLQGMSVAADAVASSV